MALADAARMTLTQTRCVLLLCCSLVAIGCGVPPEDIDEDTAALAVSSGVDYSWEHPSPASLHAAGYRFAVRYLSYDTTGKNLSRSEANALWAAGVDVVANWEWGGYDVLGGYARAPPTRAPPRARPSPMAFRRAVRSTSASTSTPNPASRRRSTRTSTASHR